MKRYEITKYENEEGIIEEQEWIAISDIGGNIWRRCFNARKI